MAGVEVQVTCRLDHEVGLIQTAGLLSAQAALVGLRRVPSEVPPARICCWPQELWVPPQVAMASREALEPWVRAACQALTAVATRAAQQEALDQAEPSSAHWQRRRAARAPQVGVVQVAEVEVAPQLRLQLPQARGSFLPEMLASPVVAQSRPQVHETAPRELEEEHLRPAVQV